DEEKVRRARFIGISAPMHTALRLGAQAAARIRSLNPDCHICFFGLYASLNAEYLLREAADSCIGGNYEGPLVALVEALDRGSGGAIADVQRAGSIAAPSLNRPPSAAPQRDLLPPLDRYAQLDDNGVLRTAGYVEASRGCLHLCRHCPIPSVYGGRYFVAPREIVLEDVRRQAAAGAKHITFGDPDFLNGPQHSIRIVEEMHQEFPELTFDCTIKIEHVVERPALFPRLRAAGCVFVVSAVESLSEHVLTILDKGHTRADVLEAIEILSDAGIAIRPTWVPFTPWTTLADYLDLFSFIDERDLVDHVDPAQYTIRLLLPPGSLLIEHEAMRPYLGALDQAVFSYSWTHPDPRMDRLQRDAADLIEEAAESGEDPAETFYRLWRLAAAIGNRPVPHRTPRARKRVPRLTEPWFC
ncbi:MAG TPA: CUAEP/CCAEP-tail radical SAM protein, partial [Armatimonadota bacterium]|nr:CUAEP/CCAEP-tail radical SAM protein [Armatimonadota bacterium]